MRSWSGQPTRRRPKYGPVPCPQGVTVSSNCNLSKTQTQAKSRGDGATGHAEAAQRSIEALQFSGDAVFTDLEAFCRALKSKGK